MKNMHVLLLCGGGGSEHEVSLRSANFLENSSAPARYRSDPGRDVCRPLALRRRSRVQAGLDKLLSFDSVARPVDYVVPCIHGYPGETGDLQSFLELAGLPYLGCDAGASKVCFNKITTKLWLTAIGIPNTLPVPDRARRGEPDRGKSGAGQVGQGLHQGGLPGALPWVATPPATRQTW